MKTLLRIFLFFAAALSGVAAADNFTVNIAGLSHYGTPDIAVDGNNTPLIVHQLSQTSSLYLLSGNQRYEPNEIPGTSSEDSFDMYPNIDVTTNSELALAYRKTEQAWYGQKGSWFDWTCSRISPPVFADLPDMELGPDDVPHLVYITGGGQYIVAHNYFDVHSGQWTEEFIFNHAYLPSDRPCIDIASDGRILIGCSNSAGIIQTAIKTNGNWSYLPSLTGFRASGAFTANDNPSVAFMLDSKLYYAVYVNDIVGWSVTFVDTLPSSDFYPVLAQSSTGVPGIAVLDVGSGGRLTYHTNVASGWTTALVDENANSIPELIFDNNDKPLIVYGALDECLNETVLKLAGTDLAYFNPADLSDDGKVNLADFAIFAQNWKLDTQPEQEKLPGDMDRNNRVDIEDLKKFICFWLGGCD